MEEEWFLLSEHFLKNLFLTRPPSKREVNYRAVQFTACSYVKRFFLKRSILQHDPIVICAGAYMLANKVEDYPPIEVQTLADAFKFKSGKKEAIIQSEQNILYAALFRQHTASTDKG